MNPYKIMELLGFNPKIVRAFKMLLESGGGLNQPAPSRSPQNTVKNQKKFF